MGGAAFRAGKPRSHNQVHPGFIIETWLRTLWTLSSFHAKNNMRPCHQELFLRVYQQTIPLSLLWCCWRQRGGGHLSCRELPLGLVVISLVWEDLPQIPSPNPLSGLMTIAPPLPSTFCVATQRRLETDRLLHLPNLKRWLHTCCTLLRVSGKPGTRTSQIPTAGCEPSLLRLPDAAPWVPAKPLQSSSRRY